MIPKKMHHKYIYIFKRTVAIVKNKPLPTCCIIIYSFIFSKVISLTVRSFVTFSPLQIILSKKMNRPIHLTGHDLIQWRIQGGGG